MTSRRTLLIGSAGLTTFAISSGVTFAAPKAMQPVQWDRTTDVLIFGAGEAGLCAAIAAREVGATVLVCEKAAFCGGHTAMSGSGYYIGGTEIQKRAGIDDSIEFNWKDSVDRGIKSYRFIKRDTSVVRRVYDEGVADMAWLEKYGVRFMPHPVQGIGNRKRVHYVAPGYKKGSPVLIDTLSKAATKLGAEIETQTALVGLITETGEPTLGVRVVGAEVKDASGKKQLIRARRGVILATGGFANSPELVKRFHPYLAGTPSLGSKLNTGDGIIAALNLGANMIIETNGFGMNMLFVGTHKGQSMGLPMTEAPLIVVGKNGERFEDESKGYLAACHKMTERKIKLADWIFDEKTYQKFRNGCLKPMFETEVVNKYDTIEALAKGEGIEVQTLRATIDQYNKDVAKGKDSRFGRTKLLATIDKPPFYAFECGPRIYTSYSGLEINRDAQVMDTRGKPITGLYAAGDVTGHLAYQCNLGGGGVSGISMATVYGKVAGTNAANNKKI